MNHHATITGTRSWKLWLALLGGAVAWTGHLLLAYAIAEFGCVAGLGHRYVLGISIVSWLIIALSILMTLLAAGAVLLSRHVGKEASEADAGSDDRTTIDFIARFGLITNGLFLFIILIESLPIFFYLGQC